jgi:hypothetical protein
METVYDTLPPVLPEFDPFLPAPVPFAPEPEVLAPPLNLPAPPAASNTSDPDDEPDKKGRPRSKISKLPKAIHQRLNELLAQGFTYRQVLNELGADVAHLNETDVSRWMTDGRHAEWRQEQAWLERTEASFKAAKEICKDNEGMSIHEANLHLAATQIFQCMSGDKKRSLAQLLDEKPEHFLRIVQAIPRYAQMALNYQKFREACAQAQNEVQRLRDPNRELTDSERNAILDKLDRILGFK